MVDVYVRALADERAGYARSPDPSRVIAVDEELARCGWCVDASGVLVEIDKVTRSKKADPVPQQRPARERAVVKAPEQVVDKG
jgi:hypothetical protein